MFFSVVMILCILFPSVAALDTLKHIHSLFKETKDFPSNIHQACPLIGGLVAAGLGFSGLWKTSIKRFLTQVHKSSHSYSEICQFSIARQTNFNLQFWAESLYTCYKYRVFMFFTCRLLIGVKMGYASR